MRAASSFLDVARPLAVQAARRITELLKSPLVRERKPDKSLVTNADHEADQILREGLRQSFPDHAILTEESGWDGPHDADYVWMVDPLDGTSAYSGGKPGYSVMVGLLREGKPFAGVVVDPLEGHIYEALNGEGAFYTLGDFRRQVHVSSRRSLKEMPVITSTDFPKKLEVKLQETLVGPWLPAVNSVGIKIGFMVRGLADIYVNHRAVHYWDTCAPQIILEEAGGILTHWDGMPLVYSLEQRSYCHTKPTLASNGLLHQEILAIL